MRSQVEHSKIDTCSTLLLEADTTEVEADALYRLNVALACGNAGVTRGAERKVSFARIDNALAGLAEDICDIGDSGAILSSRCIRRQGRERGNYNAAAT